MSAPRQTRPCGFEDGLPSRSATQHNLQNSQAPEESHQGRIVPAAACGSVAGRERPTRGKHLGLCLQIHFGIDVGGVDRDVAQPRADRVDVHARTQQVRRGCVSIIRRVELSAYDRRTPPRGWCGGECHPGMARTRQPRDDESIRRDHRENERGRLKLKTVRTTCGREGVAAKATVARRW
jgi:hypothetical protein